MVILAHYQGEDTATWTDFSQIQKLMEKIAIETCQKAIRKMLNMMHKATNIGIEITGKGKGRGC